MALPEDGTRSSAQAAWNRATAAAAAAAVAASGVSQEGPMQDDRPQTARVLFTVGIWMGSSVLSLVATKTAVDCTQLPCVLAGLQLGSLCIFQGVCSFAKKTLAVNDVPSKGSLRPTSKEILCRIATAPVSAGRLLCLVLALKNAQLSLVVTLMSVYPWFSYLADCIICRHSTTGLLPTLSLIGAGVLLYMEGVFKPSLPAVGLMMLHNFFSVFDRVIAQGMRAKGQRVSETSGPVLGLMSNAVGCLMLIGVAVWCGEFEGFFSTTSAPVGLGAAFGDGGGDAVKVDISSDSAQSAWRPTAWIALSCAASIGVGACNGTVHRRMIPSTVLVFVATSKFTVVMVEIFMMNSKPLQIFQVFGVLLTIGGGFAYGKARETAELAGARLASGPPRRVVVQSDSSRSG
eukprot:TRINITY_DN29125_c0_g1_i1.p1 TRINITY_DN29125_c0_g1~~TRINITY_DN29125_c0_g1_i1.p1  ORF type:complete len:403 (-),score=54.76 TRINITY_DN29125_c0_g1_i1:163-1371(-)